MIMEPECQLPLTLYLSFNQSAVSEHVVGLSSRAKGLFITVVVPSPCDQELS